MNPTLELEEVIDGTINSLNVDVPEELATFVARDIRDWMARNEIIFYQP